MDVRRGRFCRAAGAGRPLMLDGEPACERLGVWRGELFVRLDTLPAADAPQSPASAVVETIMLPA